MATITPDRPRPEPEAFELPSQNLPAVESRDLPEPVPFRKVVGASVIILATAIGSGEFVLWPYITSQVGLVFMWAAVAGFLILFFINMHPSMKERFTVLDGEIEFLVGRRWQRLREVVVPAGTRHAYRNASAEPAHMVTEVAPPMELEEFLSDVAALARAGRFTRRGLPTSLRAIPELAAVAQRYRSTVVLETPLRPLLRWRHGSAARARRATAPP
jgi:mannose-6-phosphate isomerase-like protein (cupin superfamily)